MSTSTKTVQFQGLPAYSVSLLCHDRPPPLVCEQCLSSIAPMMQHRGPSPSTRQRQLRRGCSRHIDRRRLCDVRLLVVKVVKLSRTQIPHLAKCAMPLLECRHVSSTISASSLAISIAKRSRFPCTPYSTRQSRRRTSSRSFELS